MNAQKISLLSVFTNFILAVLKLTVGFIVRSAGLIADGIHSGLDIISSFVTYLGTKIAKKPADEKHPYGHFRSETVAGFVVVFLLVVSAGWIIYEGVTSIIKNEPNQIGLWALSVVVLSIIVNETMARVKFKIGRKQNNLALISDAEHSRADSVSSAAVLVGLFLTRFFTWADGLTAILVGLYILYETYFLSREVIDNLLDISNPEVEKQVRKTCKEQEISLLDLKTRKIGAKNFAELKIGLDKTWKMSKVEEVTKNLQGFLLENIPDLKFVTIQVTSHNLEEGYIKSRSGQIKHFKDLPEKVKLEKKGIRTIVPIENKKLYPSFGAPEYLVLDKDRKGNILQRKIVKNPYFAIGRGHGMRFVREIEPNIILSQEIGENAAKALEEMGIKFKKVEGNKEIQKTLSNL